MVKIKDVLNDIILDTKPQKKLKILMVGMEANPYAKVGGFSYVVDHLSRALLKLGHDVRIFIPKYGSINEEKYQLRKIINDLKVPTGDKKIKYLHCNVKVSDNPAGPLTYFLENQEYYEKRANVYGYSDDPTRMALLSRGVLEFIKTEEFIPDVIHCHDWHTGIVSNYLKTVFKEDIILSNIATVYTIHSIVHQGMFDHRNVHELDIDDGRSNIESFFSERLKHQNFMRRGIIYSDIVTTVSKKYAKEVLTDEYGEGLNKLLLEVREKFFGIVNGIDYDSLNPKTDPLLHTNYDIYSLYLRKNNKKALQSEFDLEVNPDIPLLGFVGRLDYQKGVDLIVDTLNYLLDEIEVQFVLVGGGDLGLVNKLNSLKQKYPKYIGLNPYPNFTLPRLVFSGSDMILYPSRFEPCGVVQLEAMRYGAVPIVRYVGGLADTVEDFNFETMTGTGFVFKNFTLTSLYGQIVRAIELYKNKEVWQKIQKNGMSKDFSWKYSAQEYVRLYELAKSKLREI